MTETLFTTEGRVALITGAGQRIGAGIAGYLARSGATVIVNDAYEERAAAVVADITASGGAAVASVFDVTDPNQMREQLRIAQQQVGTIDILVHNAGHPLGRGGPSPFVDMPESDWMKHLDLNLVAFMRLVQLLVPPMIDAGWGRVIQISSSAATRGELFGVAGYAAAKSAGEGLMRHLAVENGRFGVTVNSLALGMQEGTARDADPVVAEVIAAIPVGRAGRPADAGAAVVWLCSPDSGQVNGQVIPVNGGAHFGR